jgi:hypothetical protein
MLWQPTASSMLMTPQPKTQATPSGPQADAIDAMQKDLHTLGLYHHRPSREQGANRHVV